jgi:hypothetical protein
VLRQVARQVEQQLAQVEQLAAQQLAQVAQLAVPLVERAHSLVQKFVQQLAQNSELARILELGESHPLVHQLQVPQLLQLLPRIVELLNLEVLVSTF